MKKVMIGVVPLIDEQRCSYWMLPGYFEGVLEAGGIPVMLPLTADRELLGQLADRLDGFLFTGGHDVSPSIYGEDALPACGECCKPRDDMESELLSLAMQQDKPVLGICRGIQFINAKLGGSLYQDLPTQIKSDIEHHQSPPYDLPVHDVRIVENTPLSTLLNAAEISVNSYHHQAIKLLSPRLRPMAFSPDGLVEAFFAPDKKFLWAVQWHPELSFKKDENSRKIFAVFVNAMK